jgi:hypothetical protein
MNTRAINSWNINSVSRGAGLSDVWTRYANLPVNVPLSLRSNPNMVHYHNP